VKGTSPALSWVGKLAIALLAVPFLATLLASGCSKPGRPGYHTVTGRVTFDGQPLANGFVQFVPVDSKTSPESGRIANGLYRLESKAGKVTVHVLSTRLTGKTDPVMGTAIEEMFIPDRYNSKSELTADVAADKANAIDFSLTSK
jgi:hypothetical protein